MTLTPDDPGRPEPPRQLTRMTQVVATIREAAGRALAEARAAAARARADARALRPQRGPAVAALGLLAAAGLAQASRTAIEGVAAPVRGFASASDGTVAAGFHWADDSGSVVVASSAPAPVLASTDGTSTSVAEAPENTPPRQRALSGLPAETGAYVTRLLQQEIATPGGLAAVDDRTSLIVTGSASIRAPGGERGISPDLKGPSPGSVWQSVPATAEPRFVLRTERPAPVTSMAFLRRPDLVAVGFLDGRVQLLVSEGSERAAPTDVAEVPAHAAPVVALAAANFIALEGADFVSMGSDRSIKIWRRLAPAEIRFAGPPPTLFHVAGGLELAQHGETLLLRVPAGTVYVARLVDDGIRSAAKVSAPDLGARIPPLERAATYTLHLVVRRDDGRTREELQLAFQRLRDTLAQTSGQPVFDDARMQLARGAIESRQPAFLAAARVVDEQTALALRSLASPLLSIVPDPVTLRQVALPAATTAATLSIDGLRLFAAGTDCIIREIDLQPVFAAQPGANVSPPVLASLAGHGSPVTHLSLSPDGEFLAAASLDRRIRIHRLSRARVISRLPLAHLPSGPPCATSPPVDPDVGARSDFQVFVQFGGAIVREQMVALARDLRGLGWNVQGANLGGERRAEALGLNVVRYGPERDRIAAEDLAREAGALSPAHVNLAVAAVPAIKPGTLEVWVSAPDEPTGPQQRQQRPPAAN